MWHLQSDAVDDEEMETGANSAPGIESGDSTAEVMQTTQFVDEVGSAQMNLVDSEASVANSDAMQKTLLSQFLSRPVRIYTTTWSSTDSIGMKFSVSPWELYFNTPTIKNKLQNFAFLRCTLRLKVVLNASPFQYGAFRLVYEPLGGYRESITGTTEQELMQASQRPGVWLEPSQNEGAEMTLPFIYNKNFLKILDDAEFTNFGYLSGYNYAPLSSANGAATNNVAIQVYAWAEKVELSGTTLGLALQGDEYGTGPISAPASAVAAVAKAAKKIPVIGKFAAATEIGASAVSKIASMFGYTNVPVLDPPRPVRLTPFPQIASTEIGYPVEKLTIDAKNELTVDPSVVGKTEDELAIANIVTRNSYVCTATWSTSDTIDKNLFSIRVNPHVPLYSVLASKPILQMTPTAFVSQMFGHWRGDLIYTFKFVCSPFHKGRVRIAHDPVDGSLQTAGDVSSVLQNTIVDLGVQREVEVRVPYQQALSWMKTTRDYTAPFTTSGTVSPVDGVDNGILSMRTLTLLTAPVSSSSIYIIVMVRGAENLEFTNPIALSGNLSPFVMQGDAYTTDIGSTKESEDIYRINFGEKVTSLRPLLHRANFLDCLIPTSGSTGTWYNNATWDLPRKAPFYGYDPYGLGTAKGLLVPASTFPFQYSQVIPLTYLARAFIGQRGSIHWHLNATSAVPIFSFTCGRFPSNATHPARYVESYNGDNDSQMQRVGIRGMSTTAGAAVTNNNQQAVLSVSCPNMTNYKFESTNPSDVNSAGLIMKDGSELEFMRVQIVTGPTTNALKDISINRYVAAGTDFTFLFFLHVPRFYVYTSVPGP